MGMDLRNVLARGDRESCDGANRTPGRQREGSEDKGRPRGPPRKFGYITPEFISLRVSSSRSSFRRLRRSIAAAPLLPPRTGHSAAIPNICSKLLRCQEQV